MRPIGDANALRHPSRPVESGDPASSTNSTSPNRFGARHTLGRATKCRTVPAAGIGSGRKGSPILYFRTEVTTPESRCPGVERSTPGASGPSSGEPPAACGKPRWGLACCRVRRRPARVSIPGFGNRAPAAAPGNALSAPRQAAATEAGCSLAVCTGSLDSVAGRLRSGALIEVKTSTSPSRGTPPGYRRSVICLVVRRSNVVSNRSPSVGDGNNNRPGMAQCGMPARRPVQAGSR